VAARTSDGRTLRLLTLIDKYKQEYPAIEVERRIRSQNVLDCLQELFVEWGVPQLLRSENGSEFTAKEILEWLE